MRPQLSAAAERTKQFGILRERAEQALGRADFTLDGVGSGIVT